MFKYIPVTARDSQVTLGDPYSRVPVELLGTTYLFDARWNETESAWYLDVLEEDETPIRVGIRMTLGAPLGWRTNDERFPGKDPDNPGLLILSDLSGENREMEFGDLGERVRLYYAPLDDLVAVDDFSVPDSPALFVQPAPLDGPDLVFVPETVEHWNMLGIPEPTIQVSTQVASGDLNSIIGASDMTTFGTGQGYEYTITGWTRKLVQQVAGQTGGWEFVSALDLGATDDFACLLYMGFNVLGTTESRFRFWNSTNFEWKTSSGGAVLLDWDGTQHTLTSFSGGEDAIRPYFLVKDESANLVYIATLEEEQSEADNTNAVSGSVFTFGASSPETTYGPLMAFWVGADATALIDAGYTDASILTALRWSLNF